jgi:hypothetical protein
MPLKKDGHAPSFFHAGVNRIAFLPLTGQELESCFESALSGAYDGVQRAPDELAKEVAP